MPEGTSIKYGAENTVSDPKIMGICANGYPHVDLDTLGVQSVEEAYYACKTALWCYLLGNWSIDGLGVNPNADQAAAERVLAATRNIYNRGVRWDHLVEPKLTATPDRDTAYPVTINGESCYQQIFTISSNTWSIEPVALSLSSGAPAGAKIMDLDNNEVTSVYARTDNGFGEAYTGQCKVVYPASSVKGQTGTAQLNLATTVVQYKLYHASVLEGQGYDNIQRYILDTDPHISAKGSAVSTFSSDSPSPSPSPATPEPDGGTALRVRKLENGTDTPLAGAVFEIKYPDGSTVGSFSTGSDGTVTVPVTITGNYTVTELTPPEFHTLPERRTQSVTVVHAQTATVTFYDDAYGSLRVEKVSDTGETLQGVTVQIKNLQTGETQSAQTGPGGVCVFSPLAPGGYEVKETAGIEGWQLDGETTRTATVVAGEESTVTLVNKELPGLRVIKYDRITLRTLPDVTFEIFRDGASLGQFKTDEMGEILLTNITGTIRVVERQSVDTHITAFYEQEIELKAGDGIRQLVFFNDRKPGMHLLKVDSANLSKPIANAKFEIKAVDGTWGPQEMTTGADGTIDLSLLPAKSFVVTELECPGYVIDDTQRMIQLKANEDVEFVFTNSKLPSLHLLKVDSKGNPVAGASYKLSKIEDASHYLDWVTSSTGEITWDGLEPGVYSLVETATLNHLILDKREYHVELFPGKVSEIVLENKIRPNLTVVKRDATTGEVIPGTVFRVKAADGHSVDEIRTGADGSATLSNLLPGVYEITEKSVPDAWLLSDETHLVTLYPNRDRTDYWENPKKPTLTVRKISSVTGGPIEGVKFNVTYASNNTASGETNDLGDYYTNANGEFSVTYLDGWYKVTELGGNGTAGYSVNATPREQFLRGGTNVVMTFEDVPLSGILVYKYDEVTKAALSNCLFQIRYLTDTSGTGGTVIGVYRTGADGSFLVTGLHEGAYVVEELSSDGRHVISTAPQTVYLSGKDQDVVPVYFGNVPNGSVLITKADALTGAPLSSVEFFVTDSTGAVLGAANGKFTTDASGSILIDNLKPGTTVVAKESKAKAGYILDDTPQTAKVIPGETVTLRFLNQPKGNLIVEKYDRVSGERLENATFRITAANGELLTDNEGLTSTNGLYTTNAEGQIVLNKVTPTTLIVTEVTAPEGYRLDSRPQTVVIQPGDTQTLRFYDDPLCTLTLFKRDAKTLAGLKGATFYVRYSDGCAIGPNSGRYVTEQDGTVTVTGIKPDATVLVSEERAPTGYIKSDEVKTIVVKSGAANSLTMDNQPSQVLIIGKYLDGTEYEPISGVGFRVVDGAGAGVGPDGGTYYTNAAGEIVLSDLEPGMTVTAYEFKTVDGMLLDGTPQTIQIKAGEVQRLRFFDKRLGTLVIKKYAQDKDKTPLDGVKFQLAYANGSYVDNANGHLSSKGIYYTSGGGEIRVNGIVGTVVATEMESIEGYYIDPNNRTQTVEINPDETQTLEFANPAAQIVVVQKLISGTTKPLSGVTFLLTDASGAPIGGGDGKFVTDSAGRITVSVAPGSTVVAQEIATVKGYALNTEKQVIQVSGSSTTAAAQQVFNAAPATAVNTLGSNNSMTFYDEELGTLILHKYISGTDNVPLSNAAFEITDGSGKAVGPDGGVYYSDKNGEVVLHNLELGASLTVREVRTVDGFRLDGTPQKIVIQSGKNELTFWNERLGALVIKKLSSADKKTPLEGVEFQLTYADGRYVDNNNGKLSSQGIYYTDSNGEIRISGVVGTIVATEQKSIDGYSLGADRSQTVVVGAGETQTLYYYNDPWQPVVIQKLISGTSKPLSGVTFLLTDASGAPIGGGDGKFVTDSAGRIMVYAAPGSTVVAQEVATVKGYALNTEKQVIQVVATSTAIPQVYNAAPATAASVQRNNSMTFYDEELGTLIVHKYITGTKEAPLAGAAFEVTDGSGKAVGPDGGIYYSDANGEVTLHNLELGASLTVREVKAPDGFELDGTPQKIVIQSGKNELTFWNERLGSLVIKKLSSADKKTPLEGVEFQLTYADGRFVDNNNGKLSSKGVYFTDSNGEIRISGVVGTIVAHETKSINGYSIGSDSTQTVVVEAGETQTLYFYNDPWQQVVIQKRISRTSKPLAGVTFLLTDGSGAPIGGGNGRYVTDSAGRITVSVAPGTTVVAQEVATVPGYALNAEKQVIQVTGASSAQQVYNAAPATLVNSGANEITVYDDELSSLTVHKYISGTDNEPLSNVGFQVSGGDGSAIGPNGGVYYTSATGDFTIRNLEAGQTITVREVKEKDGFVLDGTPQSVVIQPHTAHELTFWNQRQGALVIKKLSSADKKTPLEGAEFQLTYADGRFVDNNNGKLSSRGVYYTDSNGEIRISGVVGTIVAHETKSINGYSIGSDSTQTVVVEAGETQTLYFYNDPWQTVTLQKYADNGRKTPLQGVTFLLTDGSGAPIGGGSGEYETDRNGQIKITAPVGTVIQAKEIKTVPGYTLNTEVQTLTVQASGNVLTVGGAGTSGAAVVSSGTGTNQMTFLNKALGRLELIKVDADRSTKRLSGARFEIRRVSDQGRVKTVTTDRDGRAVIELDAGDYYAVEVEAPTSYKLDDTPTYFTIEDGRTTPVRVKNKAISGIEIHKVDSVTGEGIYGAKFLLYDAEKHPVGEYVSDQNGYVYVNDLTRDGKYFIRELECEGYNVDTQMKTITLKAGEIIQIEWKNDPITGQIQVYKYAAEYNAVTGTAAGAPLSGAVYEIVDVRSGKVVDNITTDARGVAASKALPLKRYQVKEVTAPAYWQVDATVHDVTLEYPGQIIKLSAYDKPATLGVKVSKRGNASVMAGQQMKYTITVANTSNVALDNFFWHDRIPTDIAVGTVLTTGTYSARLNYRILYKTNYSGDYQVLASNLLTSNNYSFSLNAIPTQAGEIVTEILFEFGKVPVGFQSVTAPTLSVCVNGNAANGYTMVNRADAGGKYGGTWETGNASWATQIIQLTKPAKLPKTGY